MAIESRGTIGGRHIALKTRALCEVDTWHLNPGAGYDVDTLL